MYRSVTTQYSTDLDLGRSMITKVKSDAAIGLPIYGFLLMFNSNLWPNTVPLRDIRHRNRSDLNWTFQVDSRSNVMVPLDCTYMFFSIDV